MSAATAPTAQIPARTRPPNFIVVLADCTREVAELKRRELQARVSEIELEVRAGKRVRLAVSAGHMSSPILERLGLVAVTTTTPYVYTP